MSNQSFSDFVLDQLDDLGRLRRRAMFGGYGIYCDDCFFAIVHRERLYFKTSDQTQARYEAWDMLPFEPTPRQVLKSYHEVPVDIIEDHTQLIEWAAEAVEVARQA